MIPKVLWAILSIVFLPIMPVFLVGQVRVGSPHDFYDGSGNHRESSGVAEVCVFCHAGYEDSNHPGDLLWNRDIDAGATTFTMYSNSMTGTLNAAGGREPSASSKLCLSCHDGQLAIEEYGGASGGTSRVTGDRVIGGFAGNGLDLSKDHPISVAYDAASRGGFAPTSQEMVSGRYTIGDRLEDGQVQCVTCHDVHGQEGIDHLLWVDNSTSGLCTTCHTNR